LPYLQKIILQLPKSPEQLTSE